ncbi:kinase-like protein [Terfezia boudieri ATCC MYA-4762]|uniref:non-specific serine/threonine protein kinase n=1 Tax=Terfezia boudieri ATCC MYA-4762 TaxID=1051890 RepID=A0A3N4L535_9PEZI|nr:kinase-like protein [Terfezia boudieri ATCC MYA-4762]
MQASHNHSAGRIPTAQSQPRIQTPSPEIPADRDQWRFQTVRGAMEWIEEYRPGGYHPVYLGGLFNQRYKVLRKLGYGSYSTVWLARDLSESRYVALKILKANVESPQELAILTTLSDYDVKHPGYSCALRLLDHFNHTGPNGTHLCLVTEVLGPSIGDLLSPPWRKFRDSTRYPTTVVREISKQALLALQHIHSAGVAHGDVYSGNLLCEIPNLDQETESEVLHDVWEPLETELVRRKDGLCPEGGDPWAPHRLYFPQPLQGTQEAPRIVLSQLKAKLTDFGGGGSTSQLPHTPLPFRAPERIMTSKTEALLDEKIDIWSIGFLTLFLVTDAVPLDLYLEDGEDATDDHHLLQLHDLLGPLPPSITRLWVRYDQYFDSHGQQIRNTPIGVDDVVSSPQTLRGFLSENRPLDMTESEMDDLLTMLTKMLRYDPADRVGAAEALREPWLDAQKYQLRQKQPE